MLHRSTIQLLRIHFSFLLLPVFLFALSQTLVINWTKAIYVFFILHFLIYPSSNGYNSYMDRDKTPIGGLATPLQPTSQLFYITLIMDGLAVLISLAVSPLFAMGILFYILASRAYSYRGIRLKKYPIIGFLTVLFFQGALVFFISYHAVQLPQTLRVPLLPCGISSLLIGALYPLTQIYQHEEDRKNGIITISFLLGKRGSFILSMFFFFTATFLMRYWFSQKNEAAYFYLFLSILLPVVTFFLFWMIKVWQKEEAASFINSMRMSVISALCINSFFLILILHKH